MKAQVTTQFFFYQTFFTFQLNFNGVFGLGEKLLRKK